MLGGGAGSIMDMIMRLRANRELLRKRSLFKKDKSFFAEDPEELKTPHMELVFKKVSKKELEKIKLKYAAQKRSSQRKLFIVYSVLAVLLVFGAVWFYQFMHRDYTLMKHQHRQKIEQESAARDDQFEYFLNDGDNWLYQNHYSNAIFQYKKALEVYPSDFTANLHLAIAYTYSCQVDQVYCVEARALVGKLMKTYPENKELPNLLKIVQEK